ncbi:MAG: PqqD family protein [Acidobacteria bacterium]|nr:PqqD family protein [Acidobacteriota bacterium]
MDNSQYPTARKSGLVVQEMPDELLVYDLDSNKAHCLNQSAAIIWRSCNGYNSVADIAKLVESDAGGKVSEDFVWLAIDQLSENALLEHELRAGFAGQTRREAIKKIGLASVIALPVIASLVAPETVLASLSCACQTNSDCAPPARPGCNSTTCNTISGSGQCRNQ